MAPRSPRTAGDVAAPLESSLQLWHCCAKLAEIWWTRHGSIPSAEVARHRLRALVAHARAASPLYARLYARVPHSGVELADLPATTRSQLMARFDDWCTDRTIRRERVERFLADRGRIGEPFMGRYFAWKSSGTSGVPGIFVQDAHCLATYDAMVAAQFDAQNLGPQGASRILASGARAALVVATGDHFAAITSWEHLRRAYPSGTRRSFSVLEPLPKLVASLNRFRPAMLAGYPSVLHLLARERATGRLRIEPALLWSGGEHLGERCRHDIEEAFGCRVVNEYGASECLSIAHGCREGWLHVNAEWVMLEGVDAAGRATPPGELSHTVLLTNLANWAQPVIRYDLGDRIVARDGPCPCGSLLPAIRVEGRKDALVRLRGATGETIELPPLAVSTVVEEAAEGRRFQVAQTGAQDLVVRFERDDPERERLGRLATRALRAYLATQALAHVGVALDHEAPRLDGASGKLHEVVVEGEWPRPRPR